MTRTTSFSNEIKYLKTEIHDTIMNRMWYSFEATGETQNENLEIENLKKKIDELERSGQDN